MKIQIDQKKPLPIICQYPLNSEGIEGPKPATEEYLTQGLIIPLRSPCNTPLLPVKNSYGRCVQDLGAINYIAIPGHPVVPNPHTLPLAIPLESEFLSGTDLRSAFFGIPVGPESQFCTFTQEGQ